MFRKCQICVNKDNQHKFHSPHSGKEIDINLAFDKKLANLVVILFSKCETIATTADKTNQDLILIDHKLRKLSEPCIVKLSVYDLLKDTHSE